MSDLRSGERTNIKTKAYSQELHGTAKTAAAEITSAGLQYEAGGES